MLHVNLYDEFHFENRESPILGAAYGPDFPLVYQILYSMQVIVSSNSCDLKMKMIVTTSCFL